MANNLVVDFLEVQRGSQSIT